MKPGERLLDPWSEWPEGFPYALLAAAGIDGQSTMRQVRDALFSIMERGPVDERVRVAHNQLKIVGKRLLVDALLYDPEVAAELLALLESPAEEAPSETPLSQQVPFSWDV